MRRLIVKDCPICRVDIWHKETIDIQGQKAEVTMPNDNCAHFWIKSNYSSRMKISICKTCLETLDMAGVAKIISDIVWTWMLELQENKELSEDKQRYEFEKARFYIATDFAKIEEELVSKCREP